MSTDITVPFVDLKAQYHAIKEEIDSAIASVLADTAFIKGKYLASFEENFAAYTGVKHCIGVGNGTDAIYIALRAMGIGAGDEVITVANSFIATSEAITQTGARVVFVDCHPHTYNIDTAKVEEKITADTRAIIPVHLYGQPADMDPILELAKKHGLKVLEDCAQAHGAVYKGRKAGTMGNCATFSFFPGKNLGAYGDGGAVTTSDDQLARQIRMFANHGRIAKYGHDFEGVNSRLDGLQAAILDVKLRHLEKWNLRRRQTAARYDEAFKDLLSIPGLVREVEHVYHLYVVRSTKRDALQNHLQQRGIACGVHYPTALPFLTAYQYLGHKPEDFPVAHAYMNQILSLPIHGSITDTEIEAVITAINDFPSRLL